MSVERRYNLPIITTNELTSNIEEKAELVKHLFNVNTIYGWHLTAEHALEQVDGIAPNSIVFIEGTMRDPNYAAKRIQQYVSLADARLQTGSYDELTKKQYELFVDEFLHRRHSPADEHDSHTYTLHKALFDKGCVVLPADYINSGDGETTMQDLKDKEEKLREVLATLSPSSVEDAVSLDEELIEAWLSNQTLREESAINYILYFLSKYADKTRSSSVAKATNGKAQVYVVFGLAHRNSLSNRFKSLNIPIETILLNNGEIPTGNLRDFAELLAERSEQRRENIRNHYLEILTDPTTTT